MEPSSNLLAYQWRRQLWGTGARAPPQIAESNKNCLMKS
jgi:hypothetical protein